MSSYIKDIRQKIGHRLLQMPSVTIINYDENGRVLFLKHRDTELWVAPGGAVEPCESPADAAVREMWEETGLYVELKGVLGVYGGPEFVVEYSNGDSVSYVMTVFEGSVIDGSLNLVNDESIEGAYFTREEILKLETQPWVRVILADIFSYGAGEPALFKQSEWTPENTKDR